MIFKCAELFLLLVISVYGDVLTQRISNYVILVFCTAGMITCTSLYGLKGMVDSLSGFGIPIVMLFMLFALRMLGAGDIKLFSAVGAIMGVRFVLYSMAYSFIAGGILGLIILIARKNAAERLSYLMKYIKNCFFIGRLQDYSCFSNKGDGDLLKFSIAVAAGSVLQVAITLVKG